MYNGSSVYYVLNLDRSPETYENVVNRLVVDVAGDLLLEDEGREDGVGNERKCSSKICKKK